MRSFKHFLLFIITLQCCFAMLLSCNNERLNHPNEKISEKDSLSNNEVVNPYATHDQSPMDMSYFPKDYPVLKMNGSVADVLLARVIYSRPQKKGRNIFGNTDKSLRQYGKEWRLGANEATEIEFFKPVAIAGNKIDKGRYIIYCIPYADKWTIVLNSNLYTWGLHMDTTKDVFKTEIPVVLQEPAIEDFTMVFETAPYGADLLMTWDTVKAVLPISYLK